MDSYKGWINVAFYQPFVKERMKKEYPNLIMEETRVLLGSQTGRIPWSNATWEAVRVCVFINHICIGPSFSVGHMLPVLLLNWRQSNYRE